MREAVITLALAAAVAAGAVQPAWAAPAQTAPGCAGANAARDIEAVVRGWFAAFARNDYQAGYALQAPGFYAYDNGQRYDGTTLGELVRSAKASGVTIEWNLGAVDVHAGCDEAWAAWINKGASGSGAAVQPVTWLESAGLHYQDGRWRMEFLHSGRVTPPTQSSAPAAQPAHGRHQRG